MSRLYIRVATGFYTHRKTAKLQGMVGHDAFWIPPRIWAYCAENQPDGDLSGYSAQELAMLIGYNKDACGMLVALQECRWIDKDMKVHDWEEHNGYHERYSQRAKTAADARWSKSFPSDSPSNTDQRKKVDSGDKHTTSIACSIYDLYPRRCAKKYALKCIEKQVKTHGQEVVLEATRRFADSWKGKDLQFCPHPSTWFNQERFLDLPETNAIHNPTGAETWDDLIREPGESDRDWELRRAHSCG